MELSSHGEGEIPIPINSSFGGHGHGHMIHHHHHPSAVVMPHNHILTSPTSAPAPNNNNNNNNNNGLDNNSASSLEIDHHHNHNYNNSNNNNNSSSSNKKQVIKYRECLKNHAAAMGGNATDGCGEFMPSGEEGSIEALTCSACNCHRNFHRKEIEGDDHDPQHQLIHPCDAFYPPHLNNKSRKLILGHHHKTIVHAPEPLGYPTVPAAINVPSSRTGAGHHHHHMIMSYNMAAGSLPSEADEQEDGIGGVVVASRAHHHHHQLVKKRFRTKFTPEQKEKMLNFAEKVGWKIQKQEESVVQQLCQEIGIKRRVLKVWMHNNKHNLAKKTTTTTIPITTSAAAAAAT